MIHLDLPRADAPTRWPWPQKYTLWSADKGRVWRTVTFSSYQWSQDMPVWDVLDPEAERW